MATSTSATVASINPFPNEVRIAFQAYIQGPNYINSERIPYEKWNRMHLHLDTPDLKPENPTDSRLKHRAHMEFQLVNNKLFRGLILSSQTLDMLCQRARLLILLQMNIYNISILAI
jgi:hypothetical protein